MSFFTSHPTITLVALLALTVVCFSGIIGFSVMQASRLYAWGKRLHSERHVGFAAAFIGAAFVAVLVMGFLVVRGLNTLSSMPAEARSFAVVSAQYLQGDVLGSLAINTPAVVAPSTPAPNTYKHVSDSFFCMDTWGREYEPLARAKADQILKGQDVTPETAPLVKQIYTSAHLDLFASHPECLG